MKVWATMVDRFVMKNEARIIGLGSYVPEKRLTNGDLERLVETSDEWITTRTGIKERRIAGEMECTSHMGAKAAQKALEAASCTADEIDLILVATCTPDYIFPSTANLIQRDLGIPNVPTFDLQAACSGYLYGLSTAKAFVESGAYRKVLLVATEKISSLVDWTDRSTCILFGDGAAASVISTEGEGLAIDHVILGGDGCQSDLVIVEGGGARNPTSFESVARKQHYIGMAGPELFKHAVRRMGQAAVACLDRAGVSAEELSWIVPHQANLRIIESLAKRLGLPEEKIYLTVHKYGNTSASSVPIALDELQQEQPVEAGQHILLAAVGAGLTWGSALLRRTG